MIVVTGVICGLGTHGYILAINSIYEMMQMEINKKIIKELKDCLDEFNLNEIEYSYKDTKIKKYPKKVMLSL